MLTELRSPAVFAACVLAAPALVACIAYRAGVLTTGGTAAATVVGALSVAAGWSWAALLVFFFVSSSTLSRIGDDVKDARAGGVVAKGSARDAWQVAANGGVFAIAAAASWLAPELAACAGMGALAAATSDTWATEIGMLSRHTPRSIVTWRAVPVGTSGGVTALGSFAALAGAASIASGTAFLRPFPGIAVSVGLGGIAGAVADSFLGASLQSTRHCAACDAITERVVHSCGAATRHVRGLRWMTNDAVNALATVFGAGVATTLHLSAGRA